MHEVFAGKDGFIWFQGVVEDRNDPLMLGRVKVRCLGFHTENLQELPTDDLPWAYPIQPITSAAMSGIGQTPLGPVEGTWVFGFFRDGQSAQEPMILGTIGGIPQEKSNTDEGFNDPSGTYPLEKLLNEPDTNKIARGDEQETITEKKKSNKDKMEIPQIGGGGEIEEPETPYKAKYPFNHVKQSESGHVEEVDDTPGAERLHKYHKSGTFEEIHPDGTKVVKIVGNQYEVVLKDNNLHVSGKLNITVDSDVSIYAKKNCNLQVDGDLEQVVNGDIKINAGGSMKLTASDVISLVASAIRLN